MKSKFFCLILSCLFMLSLVLASCGTKTTPTTTPITKPTTIPTTIPTTTATTTPTTKQTQAAETPQYGGTFTFRVNADASTFDPYFYPRTTGDNAIKMWLETLSTVDFNAMYQKKFNFTGSFVPLVYTAGRLVESWETPGMSTLIFHVRKGIHWQDKAPMNGREFTAYDIQYSFNRLLGKGSGFTKPSPYVSMDNYMLIDTVTATDKYTVVFKLTTPSLEQFRYLVNPIGYAAIVPQEVIQQYGDMQNWKNAVGTGPFILRDYVSGSSITTTRNSNYWGYDEVYPKNQLPYFDGVKVLIVPDSATALAALRTGKIDMIDQIPWPQADSLKKTNPELVFGTRPQNGWGIFLHVDMKPFNDIRVRQAMQKAIDIKTIAETYYGGNADPVVPGVWVQKGGYSTPFEQWPPEVQAGYTYDPQAATKLLADAGYPNGFKFTMLAASSADLDLFQVVKSYFLQIGINMDIQVIEAASFEAVTRTDKHIAQASQLVWYNSPPLQLTNQRLSSHYPYRSHINDPVYDALWNKLNTSVSDEEETILILQMFTLGTAQEWTVNLPTFNNFVFWQPWFKRYNGETPDIDGILGAISARLWIDQDLKKSMGR
jgi:peptide/nickel transport system substrate-binding protein